MKQSPRETYQDMGVVQISDLIKDDQLLFLRQQIDRLYQGNGKLRPWQFWELHHPWGRSASTLDSWAFLDLFTDPRILEVLTALIGPDIILFDSQFVPDLIEMKVVNNSYRSEAARFPVQPLSGIFLLIPFEVEKEASMIEYLPGSHLMKKSEISQSFALQPGTLICCDCRLKYRLLSHGSMTKPRVAMVRYFPASSKYIRDEGADIHRELTESYPLLNYAKLPLWQVAGQDRMENDFVTGFNAKPGRWIG